MPLTGTVAYLFAALFGLVLGSFLNVCISRLPHHQSVVTPRSRCPRCGNLIRWYDNVPVLSYVILRGRCRHCHSRISVIYPLVEIITASLFAAALARFGPTAEFLKAAVFIMLMEVLIFTDYTERIIPHAVTISGMVLGLVFSLLAPIHDRIFTDVFGLRGWPTWFVSIADALAGALFGAGLFYGVAWFFRTLVDSEKEYLGFGDVMLMLCAGLFLGITRTFMTLLIGCVGGSLIAIPVTLARRRSRSFEWPLGSFLAAAAIGAYFGGQSLILDYFGLLDRWSAYFRAARW